MQCRDGETKGPSVCSVLMCFVLISTPEFLCIQYAPFKATSSIFIPFLTSFDIFHAFNDLFWAKWPWNWKALQMNSEKVETWHGIIISPTWQVLKSWEGYGKNWMNFVYKLDNLFRSIRVSDENSSITKEFQFFSSFFLTNKYFDNFS